MKSEMGQREEEDRDMTGAKGPPDGRTFPTPATHFRNGLLSFNFQENIEGQREREMRKGTNKEGGGLIVPRTWKWEIWLVQKREIENCNIGLDNATLSKHGKSVHFHFYVSDPFLPPLYCSFLSAVGERKKIASSSYCVQKTFVIPVVLGYKMAGVVQRDTE